MLLLIKMVERKLAVFIQSAQRFVFFFRLIRADIDRHITVKYAVGRGQRKDMLPCGNLHRCRLIDRLAHLACHIPPPDQLVELELVAGQRRLDL